MTLSLAAGRTNQAQRPMSDVSNNHKHLEFIQASMSRMSGNLFLLEAWSVTLIAARFALAAKDTNKAHIVCRLFSVAHRLVLGRVFPFNGETLPVTVRAYEATQGGRYRLLNEYRAVQE